MPKSKDIHSPEAVTDYVKALTQPQGELVEAIRQIILSTDVVIGEQIKWNAPAFFYTGEMTDFNAKEYKRDIVVFNLRQKDHILLIFPTGATIKDHSGILEGDYTDGRRMVKIFDAEDLHAKKDALQRVIRNWLQLIEKP